MRADRFEAPQPYTDAENERIREWVELGLCCSEIADNLPGRTVASVYHRLRYLGLVAKPKPRPADRSQRDYLRRAENDSAKEPLNANVEQDEAFQTALKKAIADGLECATEGVCTEPCTDNPKPMRPQFPAGLRSAALLCCEFA